MRVSLHITGLTDNNIRAVLAAHARVTGGQGPTVKCEGPVCWTVDTAPLPFDDAATVLAAADRKDI